MKSSKHNRLNAIEAAIRHAHDYSMTHCGLALNKMPEYFLGVQIGQHMIAEFDNFKVRFEMSVKELAEQAGFNSAELSIARDNGRFDVVLLTKSKCVPAHVIEIKRGIKAESMLNDIVRLADICRHTHAGSRLETNYFVTVTARSEKVVNKRVEMFSQTDGNYQVPKDIQINEPRVFQLEAFDEKYITAAIYEVTYKYE
jgi:hypothetical protein